MHVNRQRGRWRDIWTYLVRIGNHGSNQLCASRSSAVAHDIHHAIPPVLFSATRHNGGLSSRKIRLELLVQHPLHRRLHHAQITGAHALVQAAHTLVSHHLLDAVPAVAVQALRHAEAALGDVLVQLQPRLDHPDGIRGRAGRHTGRDARQQMHPRRLLALVPILGHEALAVAVDIKVDASRRDDAHQVGPQALEQRARSFDAVDGAQDLQRLGQVVHCAAHGIQPPQGLRLGRSGCADLRLVKIGLESCLEHVERRCYSCGRHATNTICFQMSDRYSQESSFFNLALSESVSERRTHPPAMKCTQDFANGSALTCPRGLSSGSTSPVSRDWISAECSAGTCECWKGRRSSRPVRYGGATAGPCCCAMAGSLCVFLFFLFSLLFRLPYFLSSYY